MFDYRTYDAVKALLQEKDYRFVVAISEHIAQCPSDSVSILDVGAFDCRNTVALKLALEARNVSPSIVAIEPDPTPVSKGNARAHNIRFSPLSYQELLLQPYAVGPKTYDFILMQNLFYHIHKSEWQTLLKHTRTLMNDGSECVVSLVSRNCSLYAFITEFIKRHEVPDSERTFLKHGQYVFFEDLFGNPADFEMTEHKRFEFSSYIRLSDANSAAFRGLSPARRASIKMSALTRLSFFGRISTAFLKRIEDDAFASILRAQPVEGFQTVDQITILKKLIS